MSASRSVLAHGRGFASVTRAENAARVVCVWMSTSFLSAFFVGVSSRYLRRRVQFWLAHFVTLCFAFNDHRATFIEMYPKNSIICTPNSSCHPQTKKVAF